MLQVPMQPVKRRLALYNRMEWGSRCTGSSSENKFNEGRQGSVSQSDLFKKAKTFNLEKVGPTLILG